MNSERTAHPVVAPISLPGLPGTTPGIAALRFEDGRLSVTLHFTDEPPLSLDFDRVRGFRVLDEGDLLEFWGSETRAEGWLWAVESGGWLDQERRREGFVSGLSPSYREYLVGGQNDCVSVFSDVAPTLKAI